MTTSAGATPLSANSVLEAHRACEIIGGAHIQGDNLCEHGFVLRFAHTGDGAIYRYLAFDGETRFHMTCKADQDVQISLYVDDSQISTFTVKASSSYTKTAAEIPPIFGSHTFLIKVSGNFSAVHVTDFTFSTQI